MAQFKSPMNQWLTSCLFLERINKFGPGQKNTDWEPTFHLYGEPKDGLISCQKTFLDIGDPTGLQWAEKYLGGYEHLQVLLRCTWFLEAFTAYQDELRLKQETDGLQIIKDIAKDTGNKARFQAAKFLVDHARKKDLVKRGRPSEEEVTGELKKEVEARKSSISDAERIGLKVIEGGKSAVQS